MKLTPMRLSSITLHHPVAGTTVTFAESDLTRAVAAASSWGDLSELLRLDLIAHAAVYLLAGRDPATGQQCLRVGNLDELSRLKERWNRCLSPHDEVLVLTTDTPVLDRDDVAHWFKRLAERAWAAGRARVVRGRGPAGSPLPQARQEMLDLRLAYGRPLLAAAGCRWLEADPSDARRAA